MAPKKTSSFFDFLDLPTELRVQVWKDALQDQLTPAIFFYRKGCWQPGELLGRDEYYPDKESIEYQFRTELLTPVMVHLSLTAVNREARGIAHTWAQKQGIDVYFCEKRQHHILSRSFVRDYDILYVADDQWHDFHREFSDRWSESDIEGMTVVTSSRIEAVAVPFGLVGREKDMLQRILMHYGGVRALYVVQGNTPEPKFSNDELPWDRWWELQRTTGRSLCYNEDARVFDIEETGTILDEFDYMDLEREGRGLHEDDQIEIEIEDFGFKIIPVVAVQK